MPKLIKLSIEKLRRGQYQPRQVFDPEKLQELASSIRSVGLLQPLVVRPLAPPNHDVCYEVIAGERRWRASKMAGLETVTCLVHNDCNDPKAAEITAIENVIRVDLNPMEEAKAYQRLIHEFDYNHDQIAQTVGKSRTKITNSLRLLTLDPRVQALLKDGKLSEGHGKMIASLDQHQQTGIALECLKQGWSVRRIEQEIKKLQNPRSTLEKSKNVAALEQALSEHLGLPAKIDFNHVTGQGRLHFGFHNLDILDGFLKKIGFEK